ncbi:hypothetical protein Ciccas_000534 [Cichlidogyrus casuarinus]|uniref:Uncharacterized protein n=1 Tax=Cichlidogyrus casuarinus TaxID=1844966 RepID=A0ABD2QMY0_9PLAT
MANGSIINLHNVSINHGSSPFIPASVMPAWHTSPPGLKFACSAPEAKGFSPVADKFTNYATQVARSALEFNSGLEKVLRSESGEQEKSFNSVAKRLKARCSAEGRAGHISDFNLIAHPDRLNSRGPASQYDHLDTKRAESFLHRSRLCLPLESHKELLHLLRELSAIMTTSCSPSASIECPEKQTAFLKLMSRVMLILRFCRPLYEDFVLLLTPQQARILGCYSTLKNLFRLDVVQRSLIELKPSKRFVCRLRNLASVQDVEAHAFTVGDTSQTENSIAGLSFCRRSLITSRLLKSKHVDQISMPEAVSKTWQLINPSLRRHPLLHSQMNLCLDSTLPSSVNFAESYEECNILSRKSSLVEGTALTRNSFVNLDGIEEDTSLSSERASETKIPARVATATTHGGHLRPCNCPCHGFKAQAPRKVNSGLKRQLKRPVSQNMSVNLRHCIKCALRVHKGIVYIDECNFYMNEVEITWSAKSQGFPTRLQVQDIIPQKVMPKKSATEGVYFVEDRANTSNKELLKRLPKSKFLFCDSDFSRREFDIHFIEKEDTELPLLSMPTPTHDQDESQDCDDSMINYSDNAILM